MVRIFQLDQDFVRPWGKSVNNERQATGVGPAPWVVIDGYMDVSDARRHCQRSRSEHRHNVQIFGAILDDYPALRQRLGKRRIDDDLSRRFIRERHDGRRSERLPGTLPGGN